MVLLKLKSISYLYAFITSLQMLTFSYGSSLEGEVGRKVYYYDFRKEIDYLKEIAMTNVNQMNVLSQELKTQTTSSIMNGFNRIVENCGSYKQPQSLEKKIDNITIGYQASLNQMFNNYQLSKTNQIRIISKLNDLDKLAMLDVLVNYTADIKKLLNAISKLDQKMSANQDSESAQSTVKVPKVDHPYTASVSVYGLGKTLQNNQDMLNNEYSSDNAVPVPPMLFGKKPLDKPQLAGFATFGKPESQKLVHSELHDLLHWHFLLQFWGKSLALLMPIYLLVLFVKKQVFNYLYKL